MAFLTTVSDISFCTFATMNIMTSYLKYYLKAETVHNLHSPFMYKLVSEVVNRKSYRTEYSIAENIRKKMLGSTESIQIMDFGTGGKKQQQYQRTISKIAAESSKKKKEGRLLFRLCEYFKPDTILELGTSLGISSIYMKSAYPKTQITSFEGSPETAEWARKNFTESGFSDITVIVGNIDKTLPEYLKNNILPDIVFIDANHAYEPCIRYFELLAKNALNDSLFIFDDIHWSEGMENAWNEIKKDVRVMASVDLYTLGLVFFKKKLSKQDFTIFF